MEDTGKGLESYAQAANNSSKASSVITSGVPVAEMGDKYERDTRVLAGKVRTYLQADPYDAARIKLAKELKTEGPAWAAQYARGGSARRSSARNIYVVVDAVAGHVASYGMAPMPAVKVGKLVSQLQEAELALAAGK